jgi:membrane protease YdiL (CAAX protease family)
MTLLRAAALMAGLGALVAEVVQARQPGGFPLATLIRRWFSPAPMRAAVLIAAAAGVASVVIVPLIGALGGWTEIAPPAPFSSRWVALAIASIAVKSAYVVFEELIFRGALASQLARRVGSAAAVGGSALVFALAHSGRSPLDSAILFADGIGFALAFVMTGSLWIPTIWHLSKNLSVWLFLSSGTVDLTHGLFYVRYVNPQGTAGDAASAGGFDVAITLAIVTLAALGLRRHRWSRSAAAGRCSTR